jgi:phosphotransferase system enzyme I (PtsP)
MVRPPFYTFTKPDAAPTVISSSRRLLSRLRDTMALIGLGFRHLSMAPTSIGPVKSMVRSLSASDLEQHLESLTDFSGLSMCRILRTFAMDNSVMI